MALTAEPANDGAYAPSVSAAGRLVAFSSYASNLVPGDTADCDWGRSCSDVFVHDRATGRTERISVSSTGRQANSGSSGPAISADGRLVAFSSYASNLVPGDSNGKVDVFVHDRITGRTDRVSVSSSGRQGNRDSSGWTPPAISGDGRYIAFHSEATNLVRGDANGKADVFVHDRRARTTVRVSVSSYGRQANGASKEPTMTRDGRLVAFASDASNLAPGDDNRGTDVFVHDRARHTTVRVSIPSEGAPVIGGHAAAVAADGRTVAFLSSVGRDARVEAFVRDLPGHRTERVSVSSSGEPANDHAVRVAISTSGRHVTFVSGATNLVPSANRRCREFGAFGEYLKPCRQLFLRDRETGRTEVASISSIGYAGNGHAHGSALSDDGRYVTFESEASNLGPTYGGGCRGHIDGICSSVFVRDRSAGSTATVSLTSPRRGHVGLLDGDSRAEDLSRDAGSFVFSSSAENLVARDGNFTSDVFVRDPLRHVTELVSVAPDGRPANDASSDAAISADGRFVAFSSGADNLVAGDTNGWGDVFLRDRRLGRTTRVSVSSAGAQGDGWSGAPALSADGRFVAFHSYSSKFAPGDRNGWLDVFVHDRETGTTTRVSGPLLGDARGVGGGRDPDLSANGRYVTFSSPASDLVLGDSNERSDVFWHDVSTRETKRVSLDPDGRQFGGGSDDAAISADGMLVAFRSHRGREGRPGLYLHDVSTGKTTVVSLAATARAPRFSPDDRTLVFIDGGIRAYDLRRATARVIAPACGEADEPVISEGARYLTFTTDCRLEPRDRNGLADAYIRFLPTGRYGRASITRA